MSNQSINILTYILIFMDVILFILTAIFIILKLKEKRSQNTRNKDLKKNNKKNREKNNIEQVKEFTKESIFSFMEFDKIEDNMIIKKEKKNYLMVIE